jgi:hypothetical protein
MNPKLNPCRFCGGTGPGIIRGRTMTPPNYYVFCHTCGASGPRTGTEATAAALWNREPEAPTANPRAILSRASQLLVGLANAMNDPESQDELTNLAGALQKMAHKGISPMPPRTMAWLTDTVASILSNGIAYSETKAVYSPAGRLLDGIAIEEGLDPVPGPECPVTRRQFIACCRRALDAIDALPEIEPMPAARGDA